MRSTAVCATLFALTLGAPNATIRAQSRAPTFVGERVRISTQSPARRVRHVGRVVGVTEDSVKLQADDRATVRSIATTDIVALDASRGSGPTGGGGCSLARSLALVQERSPTTRPTESPNARRTTSSAGNWNPIEVWESSPPPSSAEWSAWPLVDSSAAPSRRSAGSADR